MAEQARRRRTTDAGSETGVAGLQSSVNEIAHQSAFVHEWRVVEGSGRASGRKRPICAPRTPRARAEAVAGRAPGCGAICPDGGGRRRHRRRGVRRRAMAGRNPRRARWSHRWSRLRRACAPRDRCRSRQAGDRGGPAAGFDHGLAIRPAIAPSAIGSVAVKLGSVEQRASATRGRSTGWKHMDAEVARLEERIKTLDAAPARPAELLPRVTRLAVVCRRSCRRRSAMLSQAARVAGMSSAEGGRGSRSAADVRRQPVALWFPSAHGASGRRAECARETSRR